MQCNVGPAQSNANCSIADKVDHKNYSVRKGLDRIMEDKLKLFYIKLTWQSDDER
jgi:hypothetical protein